MTETGMVVPLREAIQQTLDGTLGGPALLRLFMAHDDWRMPVSTDAEGKTHAVYIRDTAGQRFQLLFTDEKGYQDGCATLGAALMGEHYLRTNGCALFADLSDDTDVLSINWNSPPEIFFKKAQTPALRRWAGAVRVEQTLLAPTPDLSLLKHFDGYYIVLQKMDDGYALTLAPDAHGRKLAAVFTAEDTLDAFLKDPRGGEFNFEPVTRMMSGEHLFEDLRDMPLDGITFNCSGPLRARMFSAALATAVVAAP
jgi:hypothetical protein